MSHASTVAEVPARTLSPVQLYRLARVRWQNQFRTFGEGEQVAHYKGARGLGRITGQRLKVLFTTTRLEYKVTYQDGWKRYCPPCELVTAEQWREIVGC